MREERLLELQMIVRNMSYMRSGARLGNKLPCGRFSVKKKKKKKKEKKKKKKKEKKKKKKKKNKKEKKKKKKEDSSAVGQKPRHSFRAVSYTAGLCGQSYR